MQAEYTVNSKPKFAITEIGTAKPGGLHLIWGHGWGQSAAALLPLAEILETFASSSLIDFPGFGNSPLPAPTWGTAEYADLIAEWIITLPAMPFVWIGHSFGGRVGIQLAARHPQLLSGLVLIAAAGLKRRRTLFQWTCFELRRAAFKIVRHFVREGPQLDRLRQKFGSADYKAAGALRPILTRVVNEDLSEQAARVLCPTRLIYGTADTETPPEIGKRLKALIRKSDLVLLDGFNHLSILSEGRHQVALQIRNFIEKVSTTK